MTRSISSFVVVFVLLALLVAPAQAQSQGGEMGYLVLVKNEKPNTPFVIQAREAFDRLAPQLLAAQKEGRIISFKPEFNAGILIIKFPAGTQMAAMGDNLEIYANIHEAVKSIKRNTTNTIEKTSPALDTISPTFHLEWSNSCFWGTNLGALSRVVGLLKDKTGRLIASYEGSANGTGYINDCFDSKGSYNDFMPGFNLIFKIYTPADVSLGIFSKVIPPMVNITAINKTDASLTGKGPINKAFRSWWGHPKLDSGNNYSFVDKTGTISAKGAWSIDFGGKSFRGGDYGAIIIDYPNFTFERRYIIPFETCQLGGNYCYLYGIPGTEASMTIKHSWDSHTVTGKFSFWGSFADSFEDSAGNPIFLTLGYTASGTDIPNWNLVNLTAMVDTTTDMVSGKAPPNKWFTVCAGKSNNQGYCDWVGSNSLGNYSKSFSGSIDFVPLSVYWLEVYYVNPITGNKEFMYTNVNP